jgi:hypothetical protein
MAIGEGNVGLVGSSERTFGDEYSNAAEGNEARILNKSVTGTAAGANSHISKALMPFKGLIYVRYLDHVLYNRSVALAMSPQVREATGWLVYQCEQYITLIYDRDAGPPTLKGGDPKASGLVLLRSDIVEFKRLYELLTTQIGFEHNLKAQNALLKNRVGASRQRSEKLSSKNLGARKN